ncbi:MAG: conjugative transposon protein TraM [Cyclobacteriaceae bacterium]|nr:conjugative transposon protein TraM [Cyclobacteriaceae bacterium]
MGRRGQSSGVLREGVAGRKSTDPEQPDFNTIVREQTSLFIQAIIDEELKVEKDSRVRIRLLEDVVVGGMIIPKNRCLYGMVTSFSPQRVAIQIQSIMIDGAIQEIALDVYDLDGLKGLYVPHSSFRDVAKTMGSDLVRSQNMSIGQDPDNAMQLVYGMARDAVQTSSQAVSKAIKKTGQPSSTARLSI